MAEQGRRDDAVACAERVVLDELFEHHPVHLSKKRLTNAARSSRSGDGDVVDALAELLAQGVINQDGQEEYYWLTSAAIHIADLGWSSVSL